jgi:hypothetical protein
MKSVVTVWLVLIANAICLVLLQFYKHPLLLVCATLHPFILIGAYRIIDQALGRFALFLSCLCSIVSIVGAWLIYGRIAAWDSVFVFSSIVGAQVGVLTMIALGGRATGLGESD